MFRLTEHDRLLTVHFTLAALVYQHIAKKLPYLAQRFYCFTNPWRGAKAHQEPVVASSVNP
jgi:hypothetical protein